MNHEEMSPIPFEQMLLGLVNEYKEKGSFYEVPVYKNESHAPIGLAAGPHTQLAGNIVAGYAAGAKYFELKTVQVLEKEALGIMKPCIDVGHEVYNTEWSTELGINEALEEYIKAYLLIAVLSKVFHLTPISDIHFIASVGYDLKGIQSPKVDAFLEGLKDIQATLEWQKDIAFIKEQAKELPLSHQDIEELEARHSLTDTITLSTMHGCKRSEIKDITLYLLKEKGFHTFIKLNPTLIGKEKVESRLKVQGYKDIEVLESIFEVDMTLEMAVELVQELKKASDEVGRTFGVKLTNTLPVKNKGDRLVGDAKYLSGKPLYPIAIEAAYELAKGLEEKRYEKVQMSYSGGIDLSNIEAVLDSGITPVTVSSFVLQSGGYKNITKLIKKSEHYTKQPIRIEKLAQLAEEAKNNKSYQSGKTVQFEKKENYTSLCGQCNQCVDICPNRANVPIQWDNQKKVIHLDHLCNACGACQWQCVMGHQPYEEKFTIYHDKASYIESQKSKAWVEGNKLQIAFKALDEKQLESLKAVLMAEVERGRI